MSTYLYVDGESHFIRSEECWKAVFEGETTLENLAETSPTFRQRGGFRPQYPLANDEKRFALYRPAKYFWDFFVPSCYHPLPTNLSRAVYVTSSSGDENEKDRARRVIRRNGFEPVVLDELAMLKKRRENQLSQLRLIEKPKGVDIALATRVLEDAYVGAFQSCFLCTSDADFIPVVQAIRRIGKAVYVLGYREALGERSVFEYMPDAFLDLGELMRNLQWSRTDREKLGLVGPA